MDKIDTPTPPSLARIKARARVVRETENLSMGQSLRLASQDAGFANYHDAHLAKALPAASSRTAPNWPAGASSSPPAAFLPCHWAVIGGYYWYLDIGEHGPELWRRAPGGLAAERVSQLGIFQTQLREATVGADGREVVAWSIARYGTGPRLSLGSWTAKDADALTTHFGLPVFRDGHLAGQQQLSEQLFLCSRAFGSLRHIVKTGQLRLTFGAWNYGLTNVWNLLVALPDATFIDMGAEVVAALFERNEKGAPPDFDAAWHEASAMLEAAWPQYRFDDAELQEQIAALLPRKLGQRMRAHLAAGAGAAAEVGKAS